MRSSLSPKSSIDETQIDEAVDKVRTFLVKNYPNLIKLGLSEIELKNIDKVIERFLEQNPMLIDNITTYSLIRLIRERIVGFGILEDVIKEKEVYEVHIKGTQPILAKFFGKGKYIFKDKYYKSDKEVYQMALKLLQGDIVNGQLSYSNPEVESYMGEWRISATMNGYSNTNTITLRRQVADMTPARLIELNTASQEMVNLLHAFQQAGLRIVVAGLPDCGKTGTMIALARMLPRDKLVYSVEDTKELYLEKFLPYCTGYVVSSKDMELMTRKITAALAIKNTLNQGVETLVIGQLRKNIAFASLEALQAGLHTFMSIHCVKPEDMLNRYDNVLQYEIHKPGGFKSEITQALDIMIFQERMSDWSVKMNIFEVENNGDLRRLYYFDCLKNVDGIVKGSFKKDMDLSKDLKQIMARKGVLI